MAENTNASSSKVLNTAIWAGSAVAITGMVVFGVLPYVIQKPGSYPVAPQYPQQYAQQQPSPYQAPYYPQQQPPQPYPQQPQQPYQTQAPVATPPAARPQVATSELGGAGGVSVDSGYEITDPTLSGNVLALLKKANAVSTAPTGKEATDKNTIYAFVDPRCPFCQRAHRALNGKYSVRYLPISVLGDETTMNGALPGIRGVFRSGDRAAALNKVMETGDVSGLDVSPDGKLDADVNANMEVWAGLSARLPDQQPAVPLFVVPEGKSGNVAVVKGWHDGMPQVMDALLAK